VSATGPGPIPRASRLLDDGAISFLASAAVAVGVPVAAAGAGSAAGSGAAGAGLGVLVGAGWLDGLALVTLSIPLPALFESGGVRIAVAAPVTALVLGAFLLRLGVDRRRLHLRELPVRTSLGIALALAFAGVFAGHPGAAMREIVNLGVLLAFLVLVASILVREPERIEGTVRIFVAVAGVAGALAPLETLGILPGRFPLFGSSVNRAALGVGQPNGLAVFLAVALPLAVHTVFTARSRTGRAVAVAATGAIALGLFCTFSRGAWGSVVAGASILLFAAGRRFLLRLWGGILGGVLLLDLGSGGLVRDRVFQTFGDWIVVQRLAMAEAALRMFIDRPWTGVGPGGFAGAVDRYGAAVPELWEVRATPHNAYLQMAAESGIFGLAAFVAFMGTAFVVFLRSARAVEPDADPRSASLRRALLWSFAVVALVSLFLWPFAHGPGQAVVLILALGFADAARDPVAPARRAALLRKGRTPWSGIAQLSPREERSP